jgi:hypothetical protein
VAGFVSFDFTLLCGVIIALCDRTNISCRLFCATPTFASFASKRFVYLSAIIALLIGIWLADIIGLGGALWSVQDRGRWDSCCSRYLRRNDTFVKKK